MLEEVSVDTFILPRYVNEEKDLKTKFTQK